MHTHLRMCVHDLWHSRTIKTTLLSQQPVLAAVCQRAAPKAAKTCFAYMHRVCVKSWKLLGFDRPHGGCYILTGACLSILVLPWFSRCDLHCLLGFSERLRQSYLPFEGFYSASHLLLIYCWVSLGNPSMKRSLVFKDVHISELPWKDVEEANQRARRSGHVKKDLLYKCKAFWPVNWGRMAVY